MKRPHPLSAAALAVALLALVVSLGGASFAAKLITGAGIKNGSITAKDIKKNTLTGKQVKNGSLGAADLAAGTLPSVSLKRIAATSGANEAAARAAAPRVDLFAKGALSFYAKCFTDLSGPTTITEVYIRSSDNFAIFDSDDDELNGGPALTDFLGGGTLETDRVIISDDTGANDADMQGEGDTEFTAIAGTTVVSGDIGVAQKNGTLAAGNGPYGSGDACLVTSRFVTS
jgi:hypothetical protein